MREARNGINPLKSSLVSQFLHRIKEEMHTYPASATPTQLMPYHACSLFASEISKDPRPERHGHIPRVLFVKTVKGTLFPSTNQNYYRLKWIPVVLFPGNLEIPGIFRSVSHTISPDAQPQFLTGFKSYPRFF